MEAELTRAEASNPMDHSVEAVLPGVHSRLAAHTNEVAALKEGMIALLHEVNGMQEGMFSRIGELGRRLEERDEGLADHFQHLANRLRSSPNSPSSPAATNHPRLTNGEPVLLLTNSPANAADDGGDDSVDENPFNDPDTLPARHAMKFRHQTLTSVYNEWFGQGEFRGVPITSGLCGMEHKYGTKWRKHFKNRDKKHFSRMRSVMTAIQNKAKADGIPQTCVVDAWEETYQCECKSSIALMDRWLKRNNFAVAKKPRGKSANSGTTSDSSNLTKDSNSSNDGMPNTTDDPNDNDNKTEDVNE